ncbi:hypothetical protein [Elizabethkingia meningoseptica]|uniref:hypothetical protein n=1 Tax=Elizabethkingia meningoseptica TaxID=238 RepID=UPI002DD69E02|nr:hypothetical protein [Elizabethkingia meningoseptica]MEC4712394.1 hypothetical protein [Elizabethkingia meningoseptica]
MNVFTKNREMLANNAELKSALESLVQTQIELKKIILSSEDFIPNELLFEKSILKNSDNEYFIENTTAVAIVFLDTYISKFNFAYTTDFHATFDFLNSISIDFKKSGFVNYHREFKKEYWKVAVFDSNKKLATDFNDFISSFQKDKLVREFHSFSEAYNELLPLLDIPNNILYDNTEKLLTLLGSNATYNYNTGRVLIAIKEKCRLKKNFGRAMLNTALEEKKLNDSIISTIVCGTYENEGVDFYNECLKPKESIEELQSSIFIGISNVNNIGLTETTLFIELYDKYSANPNLAIAFLKMLFAILKSNNDYEISFIKDCFSKISSFVENIDTVYFLLTELPYMDKYETERLEIVLKIINEEYFDTQIHMHYVSFFAISLKQIESRKQVIKTIALARPFVSISKPFESFLYDIDRVELEKLIIELLIDSNSPIRAVGYDFFNNIAIVDREPFRPNILHLEPIEQYKLCVSLTQSNTEPKYIIPCLVQLFDSKSETVKELFICKLECYSENFGDTLISELENNINHSDPEHLIIIERIRLYKQDFYNNNIEIKYGIKELNPYYTHYKLFRDFGISARESMSKSISQGMEKDSFLKILSGNTIQLSKGGGFKLSGRKEISKLGLFESSIIFPREYFIFPSKYESEEFKRIHNDWKAEEFAKIEKLIENEQ